VSKYSHLDHIDEDDPSHEAVETVVFLELRGNEAYVPGLEGTVYLKDPTQLEGLRRYLQRTFDALKNSEAAELLSTNVSGFKPTTKMARIMVRLPLAVVEGVWPPYGDR
jgi:hypothetical protein